MAFFLLNYYYNIGILTKDIKEKIFLINSGSAADDKAVIKISREAYNNPAVFRKVNETEFVYHGSLYDIISETDCGDYQIIICCRDINEENFQKKFSNTKSNGNETYFPLQKYRHISSLNIISLLNGTNRQFEATFTSNLSLQPETALCENISDVPSPPPKITL